MCHVRVAHWSVCVYSVYAVPVTKRGKRGIRTTDVHYYTFVKGKKGKSKKAVRVAKPRRRRAVQSRSAAATEVAFPPLRTPFTGTATVTANGWLQLNNVELAPQSRAAFSGSGVKVRRQADPLLLFPSFKLTYIFVPAQRLQVYRVSMPGNGCGTDASPAQCQPACSTATIRSYVLDGAKSVNAFYRAMSRDAFSLTGNEADWVDCVVPQGTSVLDIPAACKQAVGDRGGDFEAFYLPRNYNRDLFDAGSTGMGQITGSVSWIKECDFGTFAHEWGHNLGLMHAGATDTDGVFREYIDISSIMSFSIDGTGGWRGLSAAQVDQMGWLPSTARLDVSTNGDYTINSLSNGSGVVAARLLSGAQWPLWLEWRQTVGVDVDLDGTAQAAFDEQSPAARGKLVGSLLIKNFTDESLSSLVAIAAPGQSVTVGGTIVQYVGAGRFIINGMAGPTVATTTIATTAPSAALLCSRVTLTSGSLTVARPGDAFLVVSQDGTNARVKHCTNSGLWIIPLQYLTSPCNSPCAIAPTSTSSTQAP